MISINATEIRISPVPIISSHKYTLFQFPLLFSSGVYLFGLLPELVFGPLVFLFACLSVILHNSEAQIQESRTPIINATFAEDVAYLWFQCHKHCGNKLFLSTIRLQNLSLLPG